MSATQSNPAQLRSPQSAQRQRVRLDRSGWGPGGRRFKSCLPDHRKSLLRATLFRSVATEYGGKTGPISTRLRVAQAQDLALTRDRRLRRAGKGLRLRVAPGPKPGGRRLRRAAFLGYAQNRLRWVTRGCRVASVTARDNRRARCRKCRTRQQCFSRSVLGAWQRERSRGPLPRRTSMIMT